MGDLLERRRPIYAIEDETFQIGLRELDREIQHLCVNYKGKPSRREYNKLLNKKDEFIEKYLRRHPELLPHVG